MSSFTNNTTNRILSSNTTFSQPSSFINTNDTTNNDTTTMGLANITGNNISNTECDSKQKFHSNISDDPYAGFYALNRPLPPTRTSPFNNLQFVTNPTG
jgi:hypothetical protein